MNRTRPQHWHESSIRVLALFMLVLAVLAAGLWGYKRYHTHQAAQQLERMTQHYASELTQQMQALDAEQQQNTAPAPDGIAQVYAAGRD